MEKKPKNRSRDIVRSAIVQVLKTGAVETADLVALYDWNTKGFYLPLGARFGKVLVLEKASWNFYVEYKTSAIYKSWEGPAVKNSFRLNASYTIPVGKK